MPIDNITEIPIDQLPPVNPNKPKKSDHIIDGTKELDPEWAEEMKFLQEPVTIRIQPPNERNPAMAVYAAYNGQGEMLVNGRWYKTVWYPTGQEITVRRATFEVLLRAQVTRVSTADFKPGQGEPDHNIYRNTTGVYSIDIIEDKSRLGAAWVTAIRRQAF